MSWSKFIALSAAGAALWGLVVVGAGMLLHEQLDAAVRVLETSGREAVAVIILLLGAFVGWQWWERRRAAKMAVTRITVDELKALIDRGGAPLVVDVRAASARRVDPRRIPAAIAIELQAIEEGRIDFPRDREIVLYCACPSEAAAAHVARVLLARGYKRARPLLGGLAAWVVAGHGVEIESCTNARDMPRLCKVSSAVRMQ